MEVDARWGMEHKVSRGFIACRLLAAQTARNVEFEDGLKWSGLRETEFMCSVVGLWVDGFNVF
ncbi:hypothetical protein EYF80_048320 [Liparis tanakae]|uniref:Uncharacterized protein n=1 Tax=Liparis tanakae TaxID=230148 RepID=A0A4Z2FL61_9TELE|nr:hypothetical protein EYF80_048320 [Liparis tanakae]